MLVSCRSFGVLLLFFLLSGDEERVKEFIQSILWAYKSEAVDLATLRKHNLGITILPVNIEQNWCYVPFSNLDTYLFKENTTKSLQHFSIIPELEIVLEAWLKLITSCFGL